MNRQSPLQIVILPIVLACLFPLSVFAQQQPAEKNSQEEIQVPEKRIEPLLPETNNNLIFVEGEDAVSTTFSREPILNYGCSSQRTLQLNRRTGLQEGSAFYAEYVFYVEEAGNYEFWYGGTPPGPGSDLLPSYCSPFRYQLDSADPVAVYREDMIVVENYTPAYYWNILGDVQLEQGPHRLRIEVSEKRGYDGKYYFYFDNFFFLRKENGIRVPGDKLPPVFPKDLENRSINNPFKTQEDYEILIRDNPSEMQYYLSYALVNSLIGDYLTALKFLKRAYLLAPDNFQVLLLTAKNKIWKGDSAGGLDTYMELLDKYPGQLEIWAEAGKISAWIGRYDDSKYFYKGGLKISPEDLNLMVNLALTHLWAGEKLEFDTVLSAAKKLAADNLDKLKALGSILMINDYPDLAATVYKEAIRAFPQQVELYTLLEKAYEKKQQTGQIKQLRELITKTFVPTEKLTTYMDVFYKKQSMKQGVIDDYVAQLKQEPDNLILRNQLAQTYFWNSQRDQAVKEYLNILVNYAFRNIQETEAGFLPLLELMDKNYAYLRYLDALPQKITQGKKELNAAFKAYEKAFNAVEKAKAKQASAGSEGTAGLSELESALAAAEDKLASLLFNLESLMTQYQEAETQHAADNDIVSRFMEEDKILNEDFQKQTEQLNWQWNQADFSNELKQAQSNGLILATHILDMINLFEGRITQVGKQVKEVFGSDAKVRGKALAFYQYTLWGKSTTDAASLLELYGNEIGEVAPYTRNMKVYLDSLAPLEQSGVAYLPGDAKSATDALVLKLSTAQSGLTKNRNMTRTSLRILHDLLKQKLTRGFYSLEYQTYLLRNELGDYYLKDKYLTQAIHQYKKVLSIDPWNMEALYKLGQAYQLNGDWKLAQENYKRVYWDDPLYGNVVGLYNQLAWEHADFFTLSLNNLVDPSKILFTGDAAFKTNLTNSLGLNLRYVLKDLRYYTNPDVRSTNQIHTIGLGFPLSLRALNLTLTPRGGVYLFANDYNRNQAPPSALAYLTDRSFLPFFQGEAALSMKSLSLSAGYSYNWKDDSLIEKETVTSYQGLSLNLNLDLGGLGIPAFRYSSFRIGGDGQLIEDGNIVYTGVGELFLAFPLWVKPYFALEVSGNFIFEDSTKPGSSSSYWSPDKNISGTAGLGLSYRFNLGEASSLSINFRGYGGYYSSAVPESGAVAGVENRFEFSKDNSVFYLGINGSSNFKLAPESHPWDYWSMNMNLGYTASLPNLLVP